jgi:hypothetical protein
MPSACNSETCSERPSRSTDQAITCRSGAARLELELARASVFQKFSKRSGLASVYRRGRRPDWSPAAPPASLARRCNGVEIDQAFRFTVVHGLLPRAATVRPLANCMAATSAPSKLIQPALNEHTVRWPCVSRRPSRFSMQSKHRNIYVVSAIVAHRSLRSIGPASGRRQSSQHRRPSSVK